MGIAEGSIEENGEVGILGKELSDLFFFVKKRIKNLANLAQSHLGELTHNIFAPFLHHFRIIFAPHRTAVVNFGSQSRTWEGKGSGCSQNSDSNQHSRGSTFPYSKYTILAIPVLAYNFDIPVVRSLAWSKIGVGQLVFRL